MNRGTRLLEPMDLPRGGYRTVGGTVPCQLLLNSTEVYVPYHESLLLPRCHCRGADERRLSGTRGPEWHPSSSRDRGRNRRSWPALPASVSAMSLVNTPQSRHPERSASQVYRVTQHLWRGVEGPRRYLSYRCCSRLFHHRSPRTGSFSGDANVERACAASENVEVAVRYSRMLAVLVVGFRERPWRLALCRVAVTADSPHSRRQSTPPAFRSSTCRASRHRPGRARR